MRRLPVLLLAMSVAACGGWPPTGGGGMAEHATPAPVPDAAVDGHLACSLRRLSAIAAAARAAGRDTGQVMVLEQQGNRARREYAGRLPVDARTTLTALDAGIDRLGHGLGVPQSALNTCAT